MALTLACHFFIMSSIFSIYIYIYIHNFFFQDGHAPCSRSACSSSCGNGSVTRTVSCQSGLQAVVRRSHHCASGSSQPNTCALKCQADCSEPEPASEDACFSSACNWTVGHLVGEAERQDKTCWRIIQGHRLVLLQCSLERK